MNKIKMLKNEWFTKSEEISDPRYGCYPGARPVPELIRNGLVVVDKPAGPTSHQVTSWVKNILHVKKAGHAGTLDPNVTGVLVIALENATKIMPALARADKEYVALAHLHKDVDKKKLLSVLKKFTGTILQVPPAKSAVRRKKRKRTVHELEMLELDGRDALLRIRCQAGTYVRKLISDFGQQLGGAHMLRLRRTASGHFVEENAVSLQKLLDMFVLWEEHGDESIREAVLPVELGVEGIPKLVIKDSAIPSITNGAPLAAGGVTHVQSGIKKGSLIALLSGKGELVALAKAMRTSREIFRAKRGLVAKTDRVIMEKGVYPRG
jgi:H/ACA ribonucleoprotein complex subunit 4